MPESFANIVVRISNAADELLDREKVLVANAERGAISHEHADSARFDIWQAEGELLHELLAAVFKEQAVRHGT